MYYKKLLFFIFFLNNVICLGQQVPNNQIECKSGIYIKSIKLNEAEERFDALFYWWFRVDSIDLTKDYSTIGATEYINAEVSQNDTVQVVLNKQERYYYITGICKASFPYKTNYINFPFENHKLTIVIENKFNNIENLKYYSVCLLFLSIYDDAATSKGHIKTLRNTTRFSSPSRPLQPPKFRPK